MQPQPPSFDSSFSSDLSVALLELEEDSDALELELELDDAVALELELDDAVASSCDRIILLSWVGLYCAAYCRSIACVAAKRQAATS